MPLKWKRNLRRIPDTISAKINSLDSESVVVAVVKKITTSDVDAGVYRHLSIRRTGSRLISPTQLVPPPDSGKFSLRNREGEEIVRKDLPKITKTYSWEVPNYGDWYNGSHDVEIDREVYQRDFLPPQEIDIQLECLVTEGEGRDAVFTVKFSVNDVIDITADDFEDRLFVALNLLQENVGSVDVFASDATRSDFLKTTHVDWQLLPPGEREHTIAQIISVMGDKSAQTRGKIEARYKTLAKLKPQEFIVGTDQFRRYFGAKFADDLVVFENLDYGNAIYIMYENWRDLSKRSRTELLGSDDAKFERIIHVTGWKSKLADLIRSRRKR